MKKNFDTIYSQPTPKNYTKYIIRNLNYQLPFVTIQRLKPIFQKLNYNPQLKITVLGSSYGLESVCLKSNISSSKLIKRWLDKTTIYQTFPPTPEYKITFVDIESKPLCYAYQVKLCDYYYVADICKPYSIELEQLLKNETDIITGIGIAYYINRESFEHLIKTTLINGKAHFLCYSIPNYQDNNYLNDICLKYGLLVKQLGEQFTQRYYASTEESIAIKSQLKNKTPLDETCITTKLYLVSNASILCD